MIFSNLVKAQPNANPLLSNLVVTAISSRLKICVFGLYMFKLPLE